MMSRKNIEEYLLMLYRVRAHEEASTQERMEITAGIKAIEHIMNPKGDLIENDLGELVKL